LIFFAAIFNCFAGKTMFALRIIIIIFYREAVK